MALGEPSSNGYFLIRVEGKDDYPRVQEVSGFLYDFNLVYEISRLATDPKYSDYRFSRSVWYRTRKPLVEQDRLHVDRLQLGSPLIFLVALAVSCLSWKWRKRSSVKIMERTYEERAQALHC